MNIHKISFTSSLLDKNKPVTTIETKTTVNPEPEEQTPEIIPEQNNSHKARNWSIGLGSAAVLIGLGVAGRKGKFGKGIQKMLGGLKEINIDAINAKLNRTIPELSDNKLKLDKIPFLEFSDLSKVKASEVIEVEDKLAQVHMLPNNYKQILLADKATKKYTQYIVQNPEGKNVLIGCFDDKGDLSGISNMDSSLIVSYGKEKSVRVVAWIRKQISKDEYIMYHSTGEINFHSITEGNIRKVINYTKTDDGKLTPNYVFYKNAQKDITIKEEIYENNGKNLTFERFYDESGNVIKTIPE